eukprot:TRINITY_DN1129_c0_g1_i3.p2 TRINITY_DN1129_c0_g1~~TRINITY_DN1129_c0_g1_i3.p2  ORF type:complete len:140 (+),score=11.54 TRINITY_DN1129_c0_g1_i3:176-595(+)
MRVVALLLAGLALALAQNTHVMPTGVEMQHDQHDVSVHGPYPAGHPSAGLHGMPDGTLMAHVDHDLVSDGPYPLGHPKSGFHDMADGTLMAHEDHDVELHGAYPAGHPLAQFPAFDHPTTAESSAAESTWNELEQFPAR